uniref:Putative CAAX amino terminal protease family protein n=1 Tax=Streptomyces sp. FR1 TaxID=349971 RepID=V9Z4S9_9ACTN|nr:CPBP family intramembrane glutamic endopeptidase [Streptomyces sp. FR1]AHE39138.1 Putative CAAX amino terminal protease family protein [Streptomyces sp. FR1]
MDVPVSALRVEEIGRLAGLAGAALWLLWLITTRPRPDGTETWWRRVVPLVGALTVIAADEAGEFTANNSSTQMAGHLAELVIWVWLCVEIAARWGLSFPFVILSRPTQLFRRRSKVERAARAKGEMVFFAYAAAVCAAVLLVDVLKRLPGPVLEGDQATAAGVPDLGPLLVHGIWSAFVEELLATAVVVAVLTAARRPLWEGLVVAALMRTLPHAYLGLWPMFAMLPLGIAAGWLYHRYRRVIPLILAHATFNTFNALFGVPLLPVLALMLTAAIWAWWETRADDKAHV